MCGIIMQKEQNGGSGIGLSIAQASRSLEEKKKKVSSKDGKSKLFQALIKVKYVYKSPAGQFERKYSNCPFKIYKNWIFITVQYSCMLSDK